MRKRKKHKKKDIIWDEIGKNSDAEFNNDKLICKNYGKKISEYDFFNHEGLCRYCRGIIIQENFPSGPPGFPGF